MANRIVCKACDGHGRIGCQQCGGSGYAGGYLVRERVPEPGSRYVLDTYGSGEAALWLERTLDGRYHLCHMDGSEGVSGGDHVAELMIDWLAQGPREVN